MHKNDYLPPPAQAQAQPAQAQAQAQEEPPPLPRKPPLPLRGGVVIGIGLVRLVTEEVKSVILPITPAAIAEAPCTIEAANSEPGRLGRLIEGRLPPDPLLDVTGDARPPPLPPLLITG